VGGAGPDALLGTPVGDLGLTLPGGSLAAARRLADRLGGAFVRLSEPHGVARVVLAGRTPAPPTQIDLADLRGPTLEADLAARELTVNALAVPLDALVGGSAPIVDPTGGLADLAARRLRACRASA